MVIAVVLSVTFLLYRASRPYVASVGRLPGHRAGFGDLSRHDDAEPIEDLLIVRLDAPLYYFNANVARSQILELVDARRPAPRAVLIDLAATADLDVTTSDMLLDLVANLGARSIPVLLAQVKSPVRERLRKTGLMDEIGEAHIHASVGSAVLAFEGGSTSDPVVEGDDTRNDQEPDPAGRPVPDRRAASHPMRTMRPVAPRVSTRSRLPRARTRHSASTRRTRSSGTPDPLEAA